MIRRIVGPVIALGGIVLFGAGLVEYFFVPSSKATFVEFFHGTVVAAMLISVGVSWASGKVLGRPTANKNARKDADPGSDQSS